MNLVSGCVGTTANSVPKCVCIKFQTYIRAINRNSFVGIATGYGLDGPSSIPTASIPALRPTQPPIQWIPGLLSLGQRGRGVKLTTHLHLVKGKDIPVPGRGGP
jgi:hypothetical protein